MSISPPLKLDTDTSVSVSHSCNCCIPRRRKNHKAKDKDVIKTDKKVTIISIPTINENTEGTEKTPSK